MDVTTLVYCDECWEREAEYHSLKRLVQPPDEHRQQRVCSFCNRFRFVARVRLDLPRPWQKKRCEDITL